MHPAQARLAHSEKRCAFMQIQLLIVLFTLNPLRVVPTRSELAISLKWVSVCFVGDISTSRCSLDGGLESRTGKDGGPVQN